MRTGFGGIMVKKDWMIRVPILQQLQIMDLSVKKLEVVRKGKDGLICEITFARILKWSFTCA